MNATYTRRKTRAAKSEVRSSDLSRAKPYYSTYCKLWAWFGCGDNAILVDTPRGIIPHAIAVYIRGEGTADNPSGCGGDWFLTEADAYAAFKAATEEASCQFAHDFERSA